MNLTSYDKTISDSAARFAKDTGPHERDEHLPYGHIGPLRRITTRPHELTILHDDGLYRHLRFRSPDHSGYWFDLITTPGVLVFRGDGDSYVFSRTEDMFGFFRGSSREEAGINPTYWSEKLTSGGRDSVMRYDPQIFERVVREHVAEAIRYSNVPRGTARAVVEMLEFGDTGWEDGARRELDRFEHGTCYAVSCSCGVEAEVPTYGDVIAWSGRHRRQTAETPGHKITDRLVQGFQFTNAAEWNFRDYDWWFLWACHAIVWGIARYNEARAAAAVAA